MLSFPLDNQLSESGSFVSGACGAVDVTEADNNDLIEVDIKWPLSVHTYMHTYIHMYMGYVYITILLCRYLKIDLNNTNYPIASPLCQ